MKPADHRRRRRGSHLLRWSALVLLACLVLGVTAFARAAGTGARALQPLDTWSRVALDGHAVRWIDPLGADPQMVYAAVDGLGIYQSEDGGSTWDGLATAGLTNLAVQTVATCPNGTLFAGTWGGGVFRYQGSGWLAVNDGLFRPYITALACDDAGGVYAGTYDAGIFKSTNNGTNWTAINTGLQNPNVLTVGYGSGYLMAGTSGGAFKSTDGGANWNAAGLPNQEVFDFAFDPLEGQRLWAATTTLGVLATTDGGGSWTQVGSGLQAYTVARNAAGQLFAGTRDDGAFQLVGDQWVDQGIDPSRVYLMRAAGTAGDRVVAGTEGGIWLGRPVPAPTATPTSTPTEPAAPSVSLTLRNSPLGPVSPSDLISYTVGYLVEGSGIAAGVVISDEVPAGTELLPDSPQPVGIASVQGDTVRWEVGDQDAGARGAVSYTVRVLGARSPAATPTATPAQARSAASQDPQRAGPTFRQADGSVVVINDGAEVSWEYQGDLHQARSAPAINGPTYYLPLVQGQPTGNGR